MYNKLFPDAKITYTGTQKLGAQLQPRFIDGSPPDVIDNSGADNLDNTALVAEGQLADLSDLMAAVSYDTEGSTFADTLVPGSQDSGVYDGKQQVLNYALSVYGIWYSSSFMEKNGYTYPKTWTDFIALCEQIKASGTAPFITTGVYPQYLQLFMFDSMLWKHGGVDVINKIDNLEDDAWRQPEVKTVLEALYQLADGGYFAEGWEGLTHTESQGEWLQGKAAFLPCGSWLEKEMKGLIPDGFEMVVAPTPSLDEDKVPFEGISSDAGEGFIVPTDGKNVQGGKEWARLLFSKEGARFFSENTKSLTVVNGAAEGLDLVTAFKSTQDAITASAGQTYVARYGGWYKDLMDEAKQAMADLMQKKISVDDYINTVQDAADTVKGDDSIPKFTRG
jgi:N-acetylglucosamine transport system substrate-binding protein